MTDQSTAAERAYQAYGAVTGFKNYQGLPMPTWPELGDTIQAAWTAAAAAVRAAALAEGADKVDAVAQAMRECDGEYPEEWSSRDIRDAVQCAAEAVRELITKA